MRREVRVRQGSVRSGRAPPDSPRELPSTAGDRADDMGPREPPPVGSAPFPPRHRRDAHLEPPGRHRLGSVAGMWQDGMARSPSRVPRPATTAATRADRRGLEVPRHHVIRSTHASNPRCRPGAGLHQPGKLRCPRYDGNERPDRTGSPAAVGSHYPHGTRRSTPLSAMGTVSTPRWHSSPPRMSQHRRIISATSVRNVPTPAPGQVRNAPTLARTDSRLPDPALGRATQSFVRIMLRTKRYV
ncbi:hypothetical protein EBESD8_23870 [Rhodococcus aetherivorans]|nr:hypothetical protein EBESD8_23870 [Rhodococcus aetherivorans]